MIRVKRVYQEPESVDGLRILVERLWPRGLKKEQVRADLWFKEVAPSPQLRAWFGHDPDKWAEFCRRYRAELEERSDLLAFLRQKSREGTVTLIYAARDEKHNSALALKGFLEG